MSAATQHVYSRPVPPDVIPIDDEVLAEELEKYIDVHMDMAWCGVTVITGLRVDPLSRIVTNVTIIKSDTPGYLHLLVLPGSGEH